MDYQMSKRKSLIPIFLLVIIIFSTSITLGLSFILNLFDNPRYSIHKLNNPSHPLFSSSNLTQTGNGVSFNYYENSWGSKVSFNLNQSSYITWETPDSWIGQRLDVTISNLIEFSPALSNHHPADITLNTGNYVNGSILSIQSIGGGIFYPMYNVEYDGTTELNLTITFNTGIDPSTVTIIEIDTWSFWTDTVPQPKPVNIYIFNYNTGLYEDTGVDAPQNTIGWANLNITSAVTDYISSSGDILINFYAESTQSGTLGEYHLDYIEIFLYHGTTSQPVSPSNVGLVLNDGFINHTVQGSVGSGSVRITGSWTNDPKYFQFYAPGHNILFNVTSTFWVYQNKPGIVSSTYYLNNSQPNPLSHLWKVEFLQDSFPSANYTNLNFSISTIPLDWNLINSTDPGGSPQILNEIQISNGKRLEADNSTKYDSGGNWEIYFNSPNYITGIELRKNLVLLPLNPELIIWDTIGIRSKFLRPIINGKVNLTISFGGLVNKSQDLSGISGSQLDFSNWQINSTASKNGTYLLTTTFYNNTEIGIYNTFITVLYPTNLTINYPTDISDIEFLKGDDINLTVFFENLFYPGNYYNEWGIPSAQVKWIISNTTGYSQSGDLLPNLDGIYKTTIDTALLGIVDGDYDLTIIANKSTYVNQSRTFGIRCFETLHPTMTYLKNIQWVSGINYTASIYPNQSLLIQLNYTDTFSGVRLVDFANISAYLYTNGGQLLNPYTTNGIRYAPGYYQVDFTSQGLPLGEYSVYINSSKTYYETSNIWIKYTIRPLEPTIRVSKLSQSTNITVPYQEWENLDISFKVEYNATMYSGYSSWKAPIDWALVRYYLIKNGGNPLNPSDVMKYGTININVGGIFQITGIDLSNVTGNFAPGDYQIYIICNATSCRQRSFIFNLTILKKLDTTLTISKYPNSFNPDRLLTIETTLDSPELAEKWHFNGKIIFYNITVIYESHPSYTFQLQDASNQYGKSEITFRLSDYAPDYLDDIVRLEITSYFYGYEAYYPLKSFYNCSSQGIEIVITESFDYTFIIIIILAVAAGATALIVIYRRVVVPKELQKTKSVNYLFTSFKDVVGLQNLFVILKSTNECILSKTYSPEGLDESMENILTNVITNYGKGDQRHDAFCDLIRFEDFMLLIDDGDFIRVGVTVGSLPSDKLIRSLVRFTQFFELQNYALLQKDKASIEVLEGVNELLDIQFGASLIAPYSINVKKASGFEETLMLMAISLMEGHGYFFLSQLYARAKSETLIDEMMIFKTIQDLMDKGIIIQYVPSKKPKPVTKRTIKTEFDRIKLDLISAKNKALKALNASQFERAAECYREAASLAASVGDFEAKDSLLKKAMECHSKSQPERPPIETYSEEEVPEPVMDETPEPISRPPDIKPATFEQPIPEITPTIKEIKKKSADLIESTEITDLGSDDDVEMTPFEKALAFTKAADLMAEEPPSTIEDEILPRIPERPIEEEALSILDEMEEIKPPAEPIPIRSPEDEALSILAETQDLTTTPEIKEEVKPEPTIPDKEIKIINNLLNETKTTLLSINESIVELKDSYHTLTKQKEKTVENINKTSKSISDKTNELLQHLLVPRKDLEAEIKIAQDEIPRIVDEIDLVDLMTVTMKKDLTTSQKELKKLMGDLEKLSQKLASVEKYLTQAPAEEILKTKDEFISIQTTYNDTLNTLSTLQNQISSLHQEVVTLMIEDIEQMMAQELKVENMIDELTKKRRDSKRVQDAFSKENNKLAEECTNLEKLNSLSDIASNEILAQKDLLNSEINRLIREVNEKSTTILESLTEKIINFAQAYTDIQILKNAITEIQQNSQHYKDKIEKTLKDLEKGNKVINTIEKRKQNIEKVIDKTINLVLPAVIQQERSFLTDFNEKLQNLVQKNHGIRMALNTERETLLHNLLPKIPALLKKLDQIMSEVMKASQDAKNLETQQFFEDLSKTLDDEKSSKVNQKPTKPQEGPITDTSLGIKQHCPYCRAIIPEKKLKLLRKNYAPECPNCGELIKPSDINLD